MNTITVTVWAGFLLLISVVIALDLGVFHRKSRVVTLPEALGWTAVWFALAMAFNVGVYYLYELNPAGWNMDTAKLSGRDAAIQFFTGYLVEKSLSVDNIFAIAMVFAYFRIPEQEQHRVLFWGVFGAVVLRAVMIIGGLAIIEKFDWLVYVLGAILIYSAGSMMVMRHDNMAADNRGLIKLVRRFVPVTDTLHGNRFFVDLSGVRTATPLFMALVLVELSDVMFAVDSIPAIFAITRDPFIVLTSNVFAILGLRSLYFVLAGMMDRFRYLKRSLIFVLAFIGVKMMLVHHYPIPNLVSLAVIGGLLSVGIVASILAGPDPAALVSPLADSLEKIAVASYRQARKAVILLVGSSVLVIGLAMVILPGPAFLVIPAGLAILAVEFVWARRWLARVRQTVDATKRRMKKMLGQENGQEPGGEKPAGRA